MIEQISIDEAVEAALNPVEFKDDVIRRTEERLKANLDKTMAEFMEENRVAVNRDLPAYSQISAVELVAQEFEKTPKRSIKRYLYK